MSAIGVSLCVLALLLGATASFEYNAYCQKLCLWGRGGNLCKCNAVHFVGKRAPSRISDLLQPQVDRLPSSIRAASPPIVGPGRHSPVGGTSGAAGLDVAGVVQSGGEKISDTTAASMKGIGGKMDDQVMLNDIRRRLRRLELGKMKHHDPL